MLHPFYLCSRKYKKNLKIGATVCKQLRILLQYFCKVNQILSVE